MNIKEIQKLIKFVSKSKAKEVSLELKDFKITIKTGDDGSKDQQIPVIPSQNQPIVINKDDLATESQSDSSQKIISTYKEEETPNDKLIIVKSPIIGTAYLAPEPGAKKFVEVGDKIKKGQTVMIVEAMKTMNHVPATADGEVKKIMIEDGQPVEFGQTLVLLK